MGRKPKSAAERTSWGMNLHTSPAETEVFDAYCAIKGRSRAATMRRLIRALTAKELSPEASEFRRLQAALPPLED